MKNLNKHINTLNFILRDTKFSSRVTLGLEEKLAFRYFINLAKKVKPELIREILTREVISNPALNNEEIISLKAQEICDYITDDREQIS